MLNYQINISIETPFSEQSWSTFGSEFHFSFSNSYFTILIYNFKIQFHFFYVPLILGTKKNSFFAFFLLNVLFFLLNLIQSKIDLHRVLNFFRINVLNSASQVQQNHKHKYYYKYHHLQSFRIPNHMDFKCLQLVSMMVYAAVVFALQCVCGLTGRRQSLHCWAVCLQWHQSLQLFCCTTSELTAVDSGFLEAFTDVSHL